MTATVAKDTVQIEMEIAPENPNLDVEATQGTIQNFSFTAFTCLHPQDPMEPYILPSNDSPTDSIFTKWLVEYPLDKVVSFRVTQGKITQDIADALDGLPQVAHSAAETVALRALAAISRYEDGPTVLSSWF